MNKNDNIEKINTDDYQKNISKKDEFQTIMEKIININNNDNIYDYYMGITNFADLFSKKRNEIEDVNSVGDSDTSKTPLFMGSSYDVDRMWSPEDNTGVVYEWNRGVIVISSNGAQATEVLDSTVNHHADATMRCLGKLGIVVDYSNQPFRMGVLGRSEGAIVFQAEGKCAFIYLPDTITMEQHDVLMNILIPRTNFDFSIEHCDQIYEDFNLDEVISFITTQAMRKPVRR